MDHEEWIGPKQVSARYDLPLSWVYTNAERGELPCYKFGKYLRFRHSELEKWAEKRRRQAESGNL